VEADVKDIPGPYTKLPLQVRDDPALTGNEMAVYWAIASHTKNKQGDAYPSQERIAEITGWSRNKVKRSLDILRSRGWIEVEKIGNGRGQRTIYHVAVEVKGFMMDTFFSKGVQNEAVKGSITEHELHVRTTKSADETAEGGSAAFENEEQEQEALSRLLGSVGLEASNG
jgi:biotin operon repressor